ncbi:hypothetical protein PENTCL1PPCAC_25151, partial [Pristionchus entomophagus]
FPSWTGIDGSLWLFLELVADQGVQFGALKRNIDLSSPSIDSSSLPPATPPLPSPASLPSALSLEERFAALVTGPDD